jgi:general secretion pathway protein G
MTDGACAAHPERAAVAACAGCAARLCDACRCRLNGRSRCARCHALAIEAPASTPTRAGRLTVAVLTVVGAAVLGVLAAGVIAFQLRAEAVSRRNQSALEGLGFTLDDFFLDLSRYPTREEGLAALVTGDPDGDGARIRGWVGPYLRLGAGGLRYDRLRGRFLDAWGNPLFYWTDPDQHWVFVASAGGNGRFDTDGLRAGAFAGRADGDDLLIWVQGP